MMNEVCNKDREGDKQPRITEEQGRAYLEKFGAFRSSGLDGMHLGMLKELPEVIATGYHP